MATYVELKGYEHGGNRKSRCQDGTLISLDQIAKELNMSKRNLQRALRIERNLTDSMKELLDTGEITKQTNVLILWLTNENKCSIIILINKKDLYELSKICYQHI